MTDADTPPIPFASGDIGMVITGAELKLCPRAAETKAIIEMQASNDLPFIPVPLGCLYLKTMFIELNRVLFSRLVRLV